MAEANPPAASTSGMLDEQLEVVDGVPVLAAESRRAVVRRWAGALSPATVERVAVVGAGVLAGAVTLRFVRRRRLRRLDRRRRRVAGSVVASRSFLVDVHVLGERK